MRVALISDIHGNLTALEAVLADLRAAGAERIVCLGDVAVNGPRPRECLALVRELGCPVVLGNADEELYQPTFDAADEQQRRVKDMIEWAVSSLSTDDFAFVKSFAAIHRFELAPAVEVLCFHGTPRSNREVLVATTPEAELAEMLGDSLTAVMSGGHTHRQLVRRYREALVLNPGSVGLPVADPGTGPAYGPLWAEYALVTAVAAEALSVDLRRVPIQLDALRRSVEGSGLPHADAWLAARR